MSSGAVLALMMAIIEPQLPLRNKSNSELPLVKGPPSARRVRPDDLFGTHFFCRDQRRLSSILKAILTLLGNNGGANRS